MLNPAVLARAGRFPHGVMVRIAERCAPSSFVGRGDPSPHPTPAALRAANQRLQSFTAGCQE